MIEEKENIIVKKSYGFVLEIIRLYKVLIEKKEYVLLHISPNSQSNIQNQHS